MHGKRILERVTFVLNIPRRAFNEQGLKRLEAFGGGPGLRVVLAGTETHEGLARLVNALMLAQELKGAPCV